MEYSEYATIKHYNLPKPTKEREGNTKADIKKKKKQCAYDQHKTDIHMRNCSGRNAFGRSVVRLLNGLSPEFTNIQSSPSIPMQYQIDNNTNTTTTNNNNNKSSAKWGIIRPWQVIRCST